MAVYNDSGVKVYAYTYDAWGNCTATPVSSIGTNRSFTFDSATVWGVTISRAVGSNISTYGIGFAWEIGASFKKGISIGKKLFGYARGGSYDIPSRINKNARELYATIRAKT